MIGAGSFVLESVWPALTLLVVIALIIGLSRGPGSGWLLVRAAYAISKPAFYFGLIVCGLLGSVFLIMPLRFAHQVADHAFLDSLKPDEVSAITVGNKTFTTHEDIATIVGPLSHNQWFSSNHGGWSVEINLTVRKRSGEERCFTTAFYLRDTGAVLRFLGPCHHGGIFTRGYAFSRDLPAALLQVGAPLPYSERSR